MRINEPGLRTKEAHIHRLHIAPGSSVVKVLYRSQQVRAFLLLYQEFLCFAEQAFDHSQRGRL